MAKWEGGSFHFGRVPRHKPLSWSNAWIGIMDATLYVNRALLPKHVKCYVVEARHYIDFNTHTYAHDVGGEPLYENRIVPGLNDEPAFYTEWERDK